LFGTDSPLGPENAVAATIADVDAAGLDQAATDAVFAGNARRLL
jgi:predicted TIM-barrel fold metal-dependent hydrolase